MGFLPIILCAPKDNGSLRKSQIGTRHTLLLVPPYQAPRRPRQVYNPLLLLHVLHNLKDQNDRRTPLLLLLPLLCLLLLLPAGLLRTPSKLLHQLSLKMNAKSWRSFLTLNQSKRRHLRLL